VRRARSIRERIRNAFAFASLVSVAPAAAEEAPVPGSSPIPGASAIAVADTVRVVRDKYPADIFKAAVAASEVDADELRTQRQIGLDEAVDMVPGAVSQSRSGGQDVRITIRGFGARGAGERSNAGTTRGIRILLDGFPITEPDGRTSLDLADIGALDRVRVVRSNASVLFGSASGGLIDLVTHTPFSKPFYELRTAYGQFGLTRAHAKGGFGIASTRVRFSVSDTRFDGWRDHSASRTTTVQASLLATPGKRTTLGVYLAGTNNDVDQPGALTWDEFEANPRQADPTYVTRDYRRENSLGRLGARLQQDFRQEDALVVAAFVEPKGLHRSERNRFRDFTRYHVGGSGLYKWTLPVGQSVHLRANSGIDAAYQDGSVLFYDLGPGGSRGTNLVANKREACANLGFYSEALLEPVEKWDLTVGARYDLARFVLEDYIDPGLDDARTMNSLSPRLAVAYHYRPAHRAYVALSGGVEAPAFNEIDPPPPWNTMTGLNPFLKPARSLTLEVGAKGLKTLSDDGKTYLRYDTAVYGLEVRDDIIPYDGGAYYLTAGKSRRAGVELGGELQTRFGMHARLAASVSHNEYIDYVNDLGDFGGNESAGIPSFGLDARLGYTAPQGLYAEGVLHALGEYFADDANRAAVPAYGILNLTAGFQRSFASHFQLDLFGGVENILDERYVASVFINGVNGRFYEPGVERNYLFGISVRNQ
jgi:iron complex outermembrane receptor protein